MRRVNLGSGPSSLRGWINYDNSYSLLASRLPNIIIKIIYTLRLIDLNHYNLIIKYKSQNIVWCNIVKRIPEKNNSVDVIYISHVIEHLDFDEIKILFSEIMRVMKDGAILRISVPDLKLLINKYIHNGDADEFIEKSMLTNKRPKSFFEKIQIILAGTRNHQWMYDDKNIIKLLKSNGFTNAIVMEPGNTLIKDHSGIDLFERADESLYIECIK